MLLYQTSLSLQSRRWGMPSWSWISEDGSRYPWTRVMHTVRNGDWRAWALGLPTATAPPAPKTHATLAAVALHVPTHTPQDPRAELMNCSEGSFCCKCDSKASMSFEGHWSHFPGITAQRTPPSAHRYAPVIPALYNFSRENNICTI